MCIRRLVLKRSRKAQLSEHFINTPLLGFANAQRQPTFELNDSAQVPYLQIFAKQINKAAHDTPDDHVWKLNKNKGKKKMWMAKKLFRYVHPKSCQLFYMRVKVFGVDVYLSGSRSEHKGELMIVASNQPSKEAIAIYLRRWEIESLFQGLKGRGFNFEATHMTHPERIAKLMGLLAVAFAWAHKVGEWKALKLPIRWKKFKKKNGFF